MYNSKMDANKREIRTIPCELAVREAPQDAQGDSRTIVGRAIVFNAESEMLDDWGYKFREVIKPEACTMEFLNSQDVKMNMLHDRSLTIARCNKGEGSMRLSVDEQGVAFEFDAPKCEHEYPHCWRCDTPLIYYARESWYIKETAVKEDLIRNNPAIKNSEIIECLRKYTRNKVFTLK